MLFHTTRIFKHAFTYDEIRSLYISTLTQANKPAMKLPFSRFSFGSSLVLHSRLEGPLGFYKGLKPNLMRVVPATAITFVTYEKVSGFLTRARREKESKRDSS